MKALLKEDILLLIEHNFEDGDVIFEDSWKLQEMWKQLGDDWFIEDGRWQLVNENKRMKKAREEWRD
ncbi:hypothetical protein Goe5_c01380 [Bacillus phage vB_BthM-Goe5]|nr:hypothetical protein Goe5_c01380 [Bacillus phage vB_BthM-Goe5]